MEHPQAAGLAAAPHRHYCLLFQVAKLIQITIEENAAPTWVYHNQCKPLSQRRQKARGHHTPLFWQLPNKIPFPVLCRSYSIKT